MEQYIGEIKLVAFDFPPRGWAFCDGSYLNVNMNRALYSLIGDTYDQGGVPSRNGFFRIPDFRGCAPMGPGLGILSNGTFSNDPLLAHPLGQYEGQSYCQLLLNQVPPHTHDFVIAGDAGTASDLPPGQPTWLAAQSTAFIAQAGAAGTGTMLPTTISSAGQRRAHENRQPYLALSFVIAITGVIPSRN